MWHKYKQRNSLKRTYDIINIFFWFRSAIFKSWSNYGMVTNKLYSMVSGSLHTHKYVHTPPVLCIRPALYRVFAWFVTGRYYICVSETTWETWETSSHESTVVHDDVIQFKHFPRYWSFVRGSHRSPVNSPHKGQWRGTLMFSLMNGWLTIIKLVTETPLRSSCRHCDD